MATIDASIPLQVQQPNLMSPMQAQTNVLNLRDLQAQTQLRNLQLQQGMQTLKDQQELSQIASDRTNIDPATGGFTPEALTKVSNPLVRQKLNQSRMDMIKQKADIDYKVSDTAKVNEDRQSKTIHDLMESSYGAFESSKDNPEVGTEKMRQKMAEGFKDLEESGRGGFSPKQIAALKAKWLNANPDDIGNTIVSHKERMAEQARVGAAERAEQTPFIKETEYINKLKGQLADLKPGDPAAKALLGQIQQVERHVAKLDAPTQTMINVSGGGALAVPPGADGKTGDEFLAALPASDRALVKKVANYEINPQNLSQRGGHREKILNLASQYNPEYNDMNYAESRKALLNFAPGTKAGDTVKFNNVAMGHMGVLRSLIPALENKDTNFVNQIKNKIGAELGSTAPTNFDAVKDLVADEVTKGVLGGMGGVTDRENTAKKIKSSSSSKQINEALDNYTRLLAGQLEGSEQQYKSGTKRKDFREKYLSPETQALMAKTDEIKEAAKTKSEIKAGEKTYTRPANFTDTQWEAYKKATGAK